MTDRQLQASNSIWARSNTANVTEAAVTVGSSDTALVAANDARIAVYIHNTHATQDVYLSLGGTAQTAKGIYLKAAGGSVKITEYTGAIRAYASGASTVVTYCEV